MEHFGGRMSELETARRTSKLETAKRLANAHFQVEPHLKFVCVLKPLHEQDPKDPIRLLEVVEGTIERGFEPIAFAADPARGIDYPVVIIEISPEEYSSVQKNGPVRFGNHDWGLGEEIARA
jgi:hypothetical protein